MKNDLIRTILLFFTISITSCYLYSQDIRGGMLNVSHINSFQYKGTLKLLIDPSLSINRPYVLIDWGPSIDTLFYVFNTPLNSQESEVEYMGFFTFPSNGTYQIRYQDTFRLSGINNISSSNLESLVLNNTLIINPFIGNNNLPQLFYNPNNIIESNGTYIINPNIVDSDGDSLYFKLINSTANGYYMPNLSSIDSSTGIVTTTPDTLGIYDLVVEVEEWRNSIFISSSVFEFVVNINTVTGINNILLQEKELTIFPNPSHNNITLILNEQGNKQLIIYNIEGKQIASYFTKEKQISIPIQNMAKGTYLIKVIADNLVQIAKFIRQ